MYDIVEDFLLHQQLVGSFVWQRGDFAWGEANTKYQH